MAEITIKGRREPIIISNERALKVKGLWKGNYQMNIQPAARTEIVDLGSWCGEIGKIASIELDSVLRDRENVQDKAAREERIHDEMLRKMTPEEKADRLGYFKLCWSMRNGLRKAPQDVLDRARKIRLAYFKANSAALEVPNEAYGDLLPVFKSPGKFLSEKMSV